MEGVVRRQAYILQQDGSAGCRTLAECRPIIQDRQTRRAGRDQRTQAATFFIQHLHADNMGEGGGGRIAFAA
jgi:hypothetical protein